MLISTIITATAALVAIIGGFLVSRVISLSSEQNAIDRKLKEINNDLTAKQDMLKRAELELFEEDVDDFIRDNLKKLLLNDKSLEQIIAEDEYNSRSMDELQPYVNELKPIINEVIQMIEHMFKDKQDLPDEFNGLLEYSKEINNPKRKKWYEMIYKEIQEMSKKQSHNDFPWNIKFTGPTIRGIEPQSYRDKTKEISRLKNDVEILTLQRIEQIRILNNYGNPKGLWSGLLVLIYACVVGIVYPSTLLPYSQEVYNDSLTKWFLLGLFFSELAVLFIYLAISLYHLTKSEYK